MIATNAVLAARIEQHARPNHIGLQENLGIFNRAVDVGLRCKVHDNVRLLAFKERIDRSTVGDITAHKGKLRIFLGIVERCKIARIGQRIIADDRILRMLTQLVVDKVRADESRPACHNNLHNLCSFLFFPRVDIRRRLIFSFIYK